MQEGKSGTPVRSLLRQRIGRIELSKVAGYHQRPWNLAAGPGLEPEPLASKASGLPLADPAVSGDALDPPGDPMI